VGAVLRWETRPRKTVRPAALIDGEWAEGAMPEPRPLYRLPDLLVAPADEPVLVTEGEPAVDAAQAALGDLAVVTTWAGGCGAVAHADWSPVAGRTVRVWPDADVHGERAARMVAAHAHTAGARRIERLRVPEEWPEGHDAADLGEDEVRQVWADASRWEVLDVDAALERHRARQRAQARRAARRRRRATPGPSPEWERRIEAARALTVADVGRLLGCGEPVRRGRELAVRCPLHEDHAPSLTFDPGGTVWFCFPCGLGGDAIELYMKATRLDFADAVRELTS